MRNTRHSRPLRTPLGCAFLLSLLGACQEIPTDALRLLSLNIDSPRTSVQVGQTLRFGVSASTPAGARLELVGLNWASSDPTIADVVDGRVVGYVPGTTYIHAYIAGIADSVLVTVHPDAAGQSIAGGSQGAVLRGGCQESRPAPLASFPTC